MRQSDLESVGWLSGGGEMGALVRAKDWAATPLGAPETWPQSIKTAVSICLNSKFPIVLWLGPELRLVYNDTYIPFLGDRKHPAMLGATGLEAWGKIWDTIGPLHAEVAAGKAVSVEHLQMFFARRLAREEVYATFGYSPILSDDCRTIEGVFCACTDLRQRSKSSASDGLRPCVISAPIRRRNAAPKQPVRTRPKSCAAIRWISHSPPSIY
jgi:hypothetical protein